MTTRGIQDPVAADLIEQMLAEQARLKEDIIDLQQARAIMMERTRPADITVPQEGQVLVDPDGSHALATTGGIKYFADGEWREITTPAPFIKLTRNVDTTIPGTDIMTNPFVVADGDTDIIATPGWDDYFEAVPFGNVPQEYVVRIYKPGIYFCRIACQFDFVTTALKRCHIGWHVMQETPSGSHHRMPWTSEATDNNVGVSDHAIITEDDIDNSTTNNVVEGLWSHATGSDRVMQCQMQLWRAGDFIPGVAL